MFVAEDDIVGIDLDQCRTDGKFTPEAAEILAKLKSYCEVSPSGAGVKIFARARLPLAKGRKGPIDSKQSIEVYTSNRFFTFTGDVVEGSPMQLRDASAELLEISSRYFKQSSNADRVAGKRPPNAVERAAAYAETIDSAIAGQDGHGRTLYFCCRIMNGFDLTEAEFWPLLDKFNARCDPPWNQRELEHKVSEAVKFGELEARGYMYSDDDLKAEATTTAEFWPLLDKFNARCDPPWNQRELEHKVSEAVKFGELEARGYMYSDDDLKAEATTTAEFLDWYEVQEPDWTETSIFPSHLIPTDGLIGDVIEWIERTNRKSQPVLAMSALSLIHI